MITACAHLQEVEDGAQAERHRPVHHLACRKKLAGKQAVSCGSTGLWEHRAPEAG